MARKAKPSTADRMIDAALALAAEKPWPRIGLPEIAAKAEASLAEAHAAFPNRACLVAAVIARHDRAMLAGAEDFQEEETRRDRLFETIMRRLEAMRPHKAALRSMAFGAAFDLPALVAGGARLSGSLRWMLRAAGVPAEGPLGLLRTKALAAVYLATLRAFAADESEDLSDTMAALDKALKRAGGFLSG